MDHHPDNTQPGEDQPMPGQSPLSPAQVYIAAVKAHNELGYFTDDELQVLLHAAQRMQPWQDPVSIFLLMDRQDEWTSDELDIASRAASAFQERNEQLITQAFTDQNRVDEP